MTPNKITHVNAIKALAECRQDYSKEIERLVDSIPMESRSPEFLSQLVMYHGKHGDMQSAQTMFNQIENPDIIAWNCLISAYGSARDSQGALSTFNLVKQCTQPNAITYLNLIKGLIVDPNTSDKQIHELFESIPDEIDKTNELLTLMISHYGKRGYIQSAINCFNQISNPNIVAYNCLIGAYAAVGDIESALKVFEDMTQSVRL